MENYILEIDNIDLENDGSLPIYQIRFMNSTTNIKLASFDLDINEIYDVNNHVNIYNIDKSDKINIFNKFISELIENKKLCGLYFVMQNGEKCILFNNEFMIFKIEAMTMECEFIVKINDKLKNEFIRINNELLDMKF